MAIKLPVWNNPYIGLPTLVAATLEAHGAAGEAVLRECQARIGRASATHLVNDGVVALNATALEWATFCGHVLKNDGYSGISVRGDGTHRMGGGDDRPLRRAVRLPALAARDRPDPVGAGSRACCRWSTRA